MYGMINEAIRTLVTREAGVEVWNQVLESSGVGDDVFEGMEGYDDSVTYSLVGAASETLGVPASDVLEMFGVYWALEVAPKGYGDYSMHLVMTLKLLLVGLMRCTLGLQRCYLTLLHLHLR